MTRLPYVGYTVSDERFFLSDFALKRWYSWPQRQFYLLPEDSLGFSLSVSLLQSRTSGYCYRSAAGIPFLLISLGVKLIVHLDVLQCLMVTVGTYLPRLTINNSRHTIIRRRLSSSLLRLLSQRL